MYMVGFKGSLKSWAPPREAGDCVKQLLLSIQSTEILHLEFVKRKD